MIIVKTKKGDCFINEKESIYVRHYKKEKKVSFDNKSGSPYCLTDVESITFISDPQAVQYTDEGSELTRRKEQINNLNEFIREKRNFIYNLYGEMLTCYGHIDSILQKSPELPVNIRGILKDEIEHLHSKILDMRI